MQFEHKIKTFEHKVNPFEHKSSHAVTYSNTSCTKSRHLNIIPSPLSMLGALQIRLFPDQIFSGLSPDDEVFVAVAAAVFVVDDGEVVVAVAEVAEGCGADEVDGVVYLHVDQGLGEVVE